MSVLAFPCERDFRLWVRARGHLSALRAAGARPVPAERVRQTVVWVELKAQGECRWAAQGVACGPGAACERPVSEQATERTGPSCPTTGL